LQSENLSTNKVFKIRDNMARKKTGIPGVSFSWKRALGISQKQAQLSRKLGIPLSRSGRQQKLGRMMGGCLLPATMLFLLAVLLVTLPLLIYT
jgi:hypothetical protein